MKAEHCESVPCKEAEAGRASEKDCTMSLKVWNQFLSDIKKECLTQNFGTLSKSEFDLLVFHYYLLEKQAKFAGKYVSDYEIGRDLGLTIQKVRSLREREALKWRSQSDWKNSFLKSLQFAHCDGNNVKIPVPDVNVIKEIRAHDTIALIPGVGMALGELFAKLV